MAVIDNVEDVLEVGDYHNGEGWKLIHNILCGIWSAHVTKHKGTKPSINICTEVIMSIILKLYLFISWLGFKFFYGLLKFTLLPSMLKKNLDFAQGQIPSGRAIVLKNYATMRKISTLSLDHECISFWLIKATTFMIR